MTTPTTAGGSFAAPAAAVAAGPNGPSRAPQVLPQPQGAGDVLDATPLGLTADGGKMQLLVAELEGAAV